MTSEDQISERPELPNELENTEAHMIISNMGLVATQLKQVPDIESGGQRVRRFGAWLGVNIVPSLDKQAAAPGTPIMLPEPPSVLIAADTLKELGERLKFEIDVMVETAQDVMDGKITLDENGVPVRAEGEGSDGDNILQGS
jgi:hypothetical protein